jgi:hypothetical protein
MHAGGMPVDEHTKLLVYARIVHAIYDIAPYVDGATPVPFLYWEDGLSAATAVIKRSVIVFAAFLILTLIMLSCPKISCPASTITDLFITAVALASLPLLYCSANDGM